MFDTIIKIVKIDFRLKLTLIKLIFDSTLHKLILDLDLNRKHMREMKICDKIDFSLRNEQYLN